VTVKCSEITLGDVARECCEVFAGALRLVSFGALTLAVVGSLLLPLFVDETHARLAVITLGVALLEHFLIEAGALALLAALTSSLRWHRLLARGRTVVERFLITVAIERALGAVSAPEGGAPLDRVDRVGEHFGEAVGRLLDCLCVAPCAPPFDLHLDADRSARTLHHIRAEVL
jgi:hypothetical protein